MTRAVQLRVCVSACPSATHARLAEPAACSACRCVGFRTWSQRPRRGRSTTRQEESSAASDRRRLACRAFTE
eukprot:5216834-Prymnesium_polylepis.1